MLIETPGGFDYTGADYQSWMRDAGLSPIDSQVLFNPVGHKVLFRGGG